ncbi:MAG: universal stress protein [Gaiellaceae bacterium]
MAAHDGLILVATDGSMAAHAAEDVAADLAVSRGAAIVVLHVSPQRGPGEGSPEGAAHDHVLQEAAERLRRLGIEPDLALSRADSASQTLGTILQVARSRRQRTDDEAGRSACMT